MKPQPTTTVALASAALPDPLTRSSPARLNAAPVFVVQSSLAEIAFRFAPSDRLPPDNGRTWWPRQPIPPRHVLRVRGGRRHQVGAGALRLCLSFDHPGRHARQCTPPGMLRHLGLAPRQSARCQASTAPIARARVGKLGIRRRVPLADLEKRRAVRPSPYIWGVGTHAFSLRDHAPFGGRPPLGSPGRRQITDPAPRRCRGVLTGRGAGDKLVVRLPFKRTRAEGGQPPRRSRRPSRKRSL